MAIATSSFGNGVLVGSGGNVTTNVHTNYQTRRSGRGTQGVVKTEGAANEVSLEFTGEFFTTVPTEQWLFVPQLPKGAIIRRAFLEVKEVFVIGGTTPTVKIGTSGSEATNGVSITEAQLEAVGTYDLTLNGTWAAPLAAATNIAAVMAGTSPTSTAVGKAELIIKYDFVPA